MDDLHGKQRLPEQGLPGLLFSTREIITTVVASTAVCRRFMEHLLFCVAVVICFLFFIHFLLRGLFHKSLGRIQQYKPIQPDKYAEKYKWSKIVSS